MALHKEEELAKKKSEGNHSSLQGPKKSTLVNTIECPERVGWFSNWDY